jgi:predicted transcriptional regulator
MVATNEDIYRELKLLRAEIKDLKNLLVPEVEPEEDELEAIKEGEKEYKAGKYVDWKALKARKSSNA